MPLAPKNEIYYSESAIKFINELVTTLYNQEYFGFMESALEYMMTMRNYIEQNIHQLPHYPAPPYFNKYKSGMSYITYQANKRTTWYIFFIQNKNRYMVYYITNNHFEGQYIR